MRVRQTRTMIAGIMIRMRMMSACASASVCAYLASSFVEIFDAAKQSTKFLTRCPRVNVISNFVLSRLYSKLSTQIHLENNDGLESI